MKAVHIAELRTALQQAYIAAARTPPTYADPVPVAGSVIRASHVYEIRTAILALESPSGGSAEVVLAAGDIAACPATGAEATARILDRLRGTVLTIGDNAYPAGTAAEFANCYGPTWGRHRVRTRPAPGNHDYATAGATGYFGYFGDRAGPAGLG